MCLYVLKTITTLAGKHPCSVASLPGGRPFSDQDIVLVYLRIYRIGRVNRVLYKSTNAEPGKSGSSFSRPPSPASTDYSTAAACCRCWWYSSSDQVLLTFTAARTSVPLWAIVTLADPLDCPGGRYCHRKVVGVVVVVVVVVGREKVGSQGRRLRRVKKGTEVGGFELDNLASSSTLA